MKERKTQEASGKIVTDECFDFVLKNVFHYNRLIRFDETQHTIVLHGIKCTNI